VTRAIFHSNQCVYLVHFRFHDKNDAIFRSNSLKNRSIKSICCVSLATYSHCDLFIVTGTEWSFLSSSSHTRYSKSILNIPGIKIFIYRKKKNFFFHLINFIFRVFHFFSVTNSSRVAGEEQNVRKWKTKGWRNIKITMNEGTWRGFYGRTEKFGEFSSICYVRLPDV